MGPIATQPKISPHTGNSTEHCGNCGTATRLGKPYCTNHVRKHNYVVSLLKRMEEQQEEQAEVKKKGDEKVDINGMTAKEILLHLRLGGGRTIKRLSREMNLHHTLISSYVEALRKKELIVVGKTNRGEPTATYVKPNNKKKRYANCS